MQTNQVAQLSNLQLDSRIPTQHRFSLVLVWLASTYNYTTHK